MEEKARGSWEKLLTLWMVPVKVAILDVRLRFRSTGVDLVGITKEIFTNKIFSMEK